MRRLVPCRLIQQEDAVGRVIPVNGTGSLIKIGVLSNSGLELSYVQIPPPVVALVSPQDAKTVMYNPGAWFDMEAYLIRMMNTAGGKGTTIEVRSVSHPDIVWSGEYE